MPFMRSSWAYLVSLFFMIAGIVVFVLSFTFFDVNEEFWEDFTFTYDEIKVIEEDNYVSSGFLSVAAPEDTSIMAQIVERDPDVIRVWFGTGEIFEIHLFGGQEIDDHIFTVYIEEGEDRFEEDAKAFETVDFASLTLLGEGTYEMEVVHIQGPKSDHNVINLTMLRPEEIGINFGTEGALIATLAGFLGLVGVVFFFVVASKRRKFYREVKQKRLNEMGIETKEQKMIRMKEITKTGQRKELVKKSTMYRLIEPKKSRYMIALGLFLLFLVLLSLTSYNLFVDETDEIMLPRITSFILLVSFISSIWLLLNTYTGRKAYFKEKARRLEARRLQEQREFEAKLEAMEDDAFFTEENKTKEDE